MFARQREELEEDSVCPVGQYGWSMATEGIGEEAGVPRRCQVLLNIENLQENTGNLFPLLPPRIVSPFPQSCRWMLLGSGFLEGKSHP